MAAEVENLPPCMHDNFGAHVNDSLQHIGKEAILTMIPDGVEVRLAGAQQSRVRRDDFPIDSPDRLGRALSSVWRTRANFSKVNLTSDRPA